jgi:hypothetical protein
MLGAVPEDLKADRRFLWTYVHLTRVTDKAVREYNAARDVIRESESIVFSGPVVGPGEVANKSHYVMLYTDHLESCVDATHRAVSAGKLLRDKGIGMSASIPDRHAAGRLARIRNAMQHTVNRLIGEDLRPGQHAFGPDDPYGINPLKHGLTIGAEPSLTYLELVGLMETCYRAAEVIGGRVGSPGVVSLRVLTSENKT